MSFSQLRRAWISNSCFMQMTQHAWSGLKRSDIPQASLSGILLCIRSLVGRATAAPLSCCQVHPMCGSSTQIWECGCRHPLLPCLLQCHLGLFLVGHRSIFLCWTFLMSSTKTPIQLCLYSVAPNQPMVVCDSSMGHQWPIVTKMFRLQGLWHHGLAHLGVSGTQSLVRGYFVWPQKCLDIID